MSATPFEDGDRQIQEALKALEALIRERVRIEQQHCPLTHLPNLLALKQTLNEFVASTDTAFWAAFLEIDKFKSVNDRFGHENANALLVAIAEMMHTMRSVFGSPTQAFRAHGDEFYFAGELLGASEDDVRRSLVLVQEAIAGIRKTVKTYGTMQCTVSIGWLTSEDLLAIGGPITDRTILDALEHANQKAKRTRRGSIERYSGKETEGDWISERADCAKCGCRFSLDVEAAKHLGGAPLRCPNCGAEVARPAADVAAPKELAKI